MAVLAAVKSEKEKCEHEWKKEIIMLPRDNPEYQHGRAAFKIKKCIKCKEVIYQEYKIERL